MFAQMKSIDRYFVIFMFIAVAACDQDNSLGSGAERSTETKPFATLDTREAQPSGSTDGYVATNKGSSNMQVKGKLDASGQVILFVGDRTISIRAPNCIEETETLLQCRGEVELLVQMGAQSVQRIVLPFFFFDSTASLYRGPLHNVEVKNHSLILSDVNNDGIEDLLVWTGKEGAYGGPSFDVYLMHSSTGQFELSEAFSELTVGYNGLFTVDGNTIKTVASSGCCLHVFETYQIQQNQPVLIERITEDSTDPGKPVKTKEVLVDGILKKIT